MGQLTAVDPQNSCRFYRVNLFTNAISRFTTISMVKALKINRVDSRIVGSNPSLFKNKMEGYPEKIKI